MNVKCELKCFYLFKTLQPQDSRQEHDTMQIISEYLQDVLQFVFQLGCEIFSSTTPLMVNHRNCVAVKHNGKYGLIVLSDLISKSVVFSLRYTV